MNSKNKWLLSLILALASAILMQTQGAFLKTPSTPLGIVSLELASSVALVQQILATWNYHGVVLNIGLDFLFIPAYTFFFICSLVSLTEKHGLTWLQWLGKKLMILAYVAAVLDVIENILMLNTIMGKYTAGSIYATATVATCKFACIAFILIYLIGSLPRFFVGSKQGA